MGGGVKLKMKSIKYTWSEPFIKVVLKPQTKMRSCLWFTFMTHFKYRLLYLLLKHIFQGLLHWLICYLLSLRLMLNLILTDVIVMTLGVSYRENKGWVYGKQCQICKRMQLYRSLYDSDPGVFIFPRSCPGVVHVVWFRVLELHQSDCQRFLHT